jgi:hypothetical protein
MSIQFSTWESSHQTPNKNEWQREVIDALMDEPDYNDYALEDVLAD